MIDKEDLQQLLKEIEARFPGKIPGVEHIFDDAEIVDEDGD